MTDPSQYQRWMRLAQFHGWATNAHIAAIEAEAVAAALDALAARVEGLDGQIHPMCAVEGEPTDRKVVSRKAVLAAIAEARRGP